MPFPSDPLTIAGKAFSSRLLLGTGKFKDLELMNAVLEASGTGIVTVAIRRVELRAPGHVGLLESLDLTRYQLLPNTAGCRTAEEAVRVARLARAVLALSQELIATYRDIGGMIHKRQLHSGWGDEVIGRLARDLQAALPGTGSYSRRNLYRMWAPYLAYPDESEFASQPVAQLPWGHVIMLLERVKDVNKRRWYGEQALKFG